MRERDDSERIVAMVRQAHRDRMPLAIVGSGSKSFLGHSLNDRVLSISDHVGILDYRADELVVTARAGTPLGELDLVLAAERQMLPFDPPLFATGGTLGGAVAVGLAGPGRPWTGSVRDAVLGVEIVTGTGERLRFGGQVMKNVAGYDVSRLMVGAFGTLGVLLSVSVRVLPRPETEATCALALPRDEALSRVVALGRESGPVSATYHVDDRLYVRFSGAGVAVQKAAARLGGERSGHSDNRWRSVRDQREPFFRRGPIWRVSLPFSAAYPAVEGDWATEWGGAQRWLRTDAPAVEVFAAARAAGGYAAGFRDAGSMLEPLDEAPLRYHRRLKEVFDPVGTLNRGRMYPEV